MADNCRDFAWGNIKANPVESKYVMLSCRECKSNVLESDSRNRRWVRHRSDCKRSRIATLHRHIELSAVLLFIDFPVQTLFCGSVQLANLLVHNSPSWVGSTEGIILTSTATLILFSHIVFVIRHPRG